MQDEGFYVGKPLGKFVDKILGKWEKRPPTEKNVLIVGKRGSGKAVGHVRHIIIHPGETLSEMLEERGMTQDELAAKSGLTVEIIGSIIDESVDISPEIAEGLSRVFGMSEEFWLKLQEFYVKSKENEKAHS